ncbi:response regulator transcription factor [Methylomicrobium lacus]|uniref:response regulator transcription factor n=1 Tax=Methylomicrobium lacus TaxID=136992 RepID=UPI0035A89586
MTIAFIEQNDPAPDNKEPCGLSRLSVALLGFETADEEKLKRVLQMERPDGRKYMAVSRGDKIQGDILLVNYDNPGAREEKDLILASYPQAQVVAVSRGPLQDAPARHIRGMLSAARVLAVLDQVSVPKPIEPALAGLPTADDDSLSRQVDPQDRSTAESGLSETPTSPSLSGHAGYRALVVDDSAAIQKSLELNLATLPQIGAVEFADSGEAALAKAETAQYDLIFLDVMMPGIDGYETCTQLRKKAQYKKTPIIMVSGKTSPLDEVKGVMAGCTTYLTKPVQAEAFQKLGARVLAWLERQARP